MKQSLIGLFILATLVGCIEQLPEPQGPQPEESIHHDSDTTFLSVRLCNIPDIKSSISPEEGKIENLNLYAYRDGILEAEAYSTTSSQVTVKLARGCTYNLYALANTGRVTAPAKEDDLLAYRYGISSISDLSATLPMAWKKQSFTASRSTMNLDVWMERLAAKVSFSLDKSALDGIEVKSIRLRQSACKVAPFTASAATAGSETISGDYASEADLASVNAGESIFFYTLENCQGTLLPTNTDPWGKIPDAVGAKAGLCTYIEVQCSFAEGFLLAGNVTYRLYPGSDNVTNFDIRRNTNMAISLCLTGDGLKEVSWKVTANVTVQDGFASGWLDEGMHGLDNLYIGEQFCYGVDVDPELYEYLGGDLGRCSLRFISSGAGAMEFSPSEHTPGYMTMYAYGTCTAAGDGVIWLYGPDGSPLASVSGTATIRKPRLIQSFMASCAPSETIESLDECPYCIINGDKKPIYIYLADSDGYNLNTDYYCGFDLSQFDFETSPYWESDFDIGDTFKIETVAGRSNSDGPAITYQISCENDGTSRVANVGLGEAVRSIVAVNYDIDDLRHDISGSGEAGLYFHPITLTMVDNGWAKYYPSQLSLKVDNPSNMPLTIDIWQANKTDDFWNALSRNEIIDVVEQQYDVNRIQYVTNTYYDGSRTLYGDMHRIYSERSPYGDSYIEDDGQLVYSLKNISTSVLQNTMIYDKRGHDVLHHLMDVRLNRDVLYRSEVEFIDHLSDGSMKYDIIYGNDPEYGGGWDDKGIWGFSSNRLLYSPGTSLDGYYNISALRLSNLYERKNNAVNLKVSYDSASGRLDVSCPQGNRYGIRLDASITVTADGYVKTYPKGTWFGAKDNYCSSSVVKTVSSVSVGTSNVPLDGGAVKECMDKIYAQTFFDSKNNIGSANNYQHRAHPTTVRVALKLKVSGSNSEYYPLTINWTNSLIPYYHAQDGTTYYPAFRPAYSSFEFIQARKK